MSKKILMLKSNECGSRDSTNMKTYDIIEDILNVWKKTSDEDDLDIIPYEYTNENLEKYKNYNCERWITIEDDSSSDSFQMYDDEDRFILFENDKELAHGLIDKIEGLDKAIINMVKLFDMK